MADLQVQSARRAELLNLSYRYVLEHGLFGLSLRPLAAAVGSSPRVLLFLFGSKEGLVGEILASARREELKALEGGITSAASLRTVWDWLSNPEHRQLMNIWVECYSLSISTPDGPWAGWAVRTVDDWLAILTPNGDRIRATMELAVLRGCLLDLLATNDPQRTSAAITRFLDEHGHL